MEDLVKLLIFACLLFWPLTFAAPVEPHESGGTEHVVIIDKSNPTPPRVADVLERLALHEGHADVHHIFNNSAFVGFAASMKSHCLDLLANMTDVRRVEASVNVQHALVHPSTSRNRHRRQTSSSVYATRPDAPWGLQRISTSTNVHGNAKAMDYTYSYPASTASDSSSSATLGQGADIYILDTGVYTAHNIFSDRASMVWSYDNHMADVDGHGTHVAGTAAGSILGVASNANLFGVKALDADGGGYSSNVVAGIDYIVNSHERRKREQGDKFVGSVISVSLAASGTVAAISDAVEAAVEAGVHVVVAAGNQHVDACGTSPSDSGGRGGPAITVGSVGMEGRESSFSNYGDCVDVYAPAQYCCMQRQTWPCEEEFGSLGCFDSVDKIDLRRRLNPSRAVVFNNPDPRNLLLHCHCLAEKFQEQIVFVGQGERRKKEGEKEIKDERRTETLKVDISFSKT